MKDSESSDLLFHYQSSVFVTKIFAHFYAPSSYLILAISSHVTFCQLLPLLCISQMKLFKVLDLPVNYL